MSDQPAPEVEKTFDHEATYSPEDNKIRIYPGYRFPKDEYNQLRAAGFKWAPKQEIFVAPMWTPDREDLALEFCGYIGDEIKPRAERAADRAERFAGYLDKRLGEAVSSADRYDAGPAIHGHQSQKRAEASARRHDRIASRACGFWGKAEYWKSRVSGVISNALYAERADVRQRRIRGIESDLRKNQKNKAEREKFIQHWQNVVVMEKEGKAQQAGNLAEAIAGYHHFDIVTEEEKAKAGCIWQSPYEALKIGIPLAEVSRRCIEKLEGYAEYAARWEEHYNLRLTFERAMLGDQGGTADDKAGGEMVKGGRVLLRLKYGTGQAWFTLRKVNKGANGQTNSICTVEDSKAAHWSHIIPSENVLQYEAPTVETIKAAKACKITLPPLVNEKTPGCHEILAALYAKCVKRQSGEVRYGAIESDGKRQQFRYRYAYLANKWACVFLTDKPEVKRPVASPAKKETPAPALVNA